MPYEGGPYIQAACFCEYVLEDKGGSISLIHIFDRVNHEATGPNPPAEMQPFVHSFFLAVMLKSGSARGRNTVQIIPELPTGATKPPMIFDVRFEGEEQGTNVLIRIEFQFEHEGLYWFDVKVGDELLDRIPLRINYNRRIINIRQP